MIRYALVCAKGHPTEAWFRGSADFDRELAAGRLTCPVCGTADMRKAMMAPAIATSRRAESEGPVPAMAPAPAGPGPEAGSIPGAAGSHEPGGPGGTPSAPDPVPVMASDPRHAALREMLREVRKQVTANSDYVGPRFAEEARKIHYKETQPRGIHGEASPEEAKALADDGIDFQPLPPFPDDRN